MAARQQITIELVDKVSNSLGNIERRLGTLERRTGTVANGMNRAGFAAKAFVGALAVRQIVDFGLKIAEVSDRFQQYENQLKLITGSQEELDATMNMLTQTAIANRASFGDTVELYSKLSLATQDLGVSQEQLTRVTSNFQRALAISGADANTASGAIRQFGQAMASGTVRGDEFNSIVEALGPALNIMAQESGINIGRLREMSQAGELTAETFFAMIENSRTLNAAFEETDITLGQLAQQTEDAFDRMINRMDEAVGASNFFKEELRDLGRAFDYLAGTPTAPVNMTNQQLADFSNNNITASQALEELNNRLELVSITGQYLGGIFRQDARDFEELTAIIAEVNRQMEEAKAALDAAAAGGENASGAMSQLDLALAALVPYEGLIKRVADTDSLYELGDAITQAEMDLTQLQRAQRALRDVMNESNEVSLEQLTQMRGLSEAIIVQEARLADLREELRRSNMKEFAESVADATQNLGQYESIVRSAMTEQQQMAAEIAEAEIYLTELENAARTGGDAMAQALAPAINTVSSALRLMRGELANAGSELSGFDLYYNNLIESASRAAQESVFAVQAQQRLNADLAAGRINVDQYAAAMQRYTTNTRKAGGATRDLAGEVQNLREKYSEYLGNQIQLATEAQARDVEIFKDALSQKLISEEEYNRLVIASREALADRINKINEDITKREQDQLLERVKNQLAAGNTIIAASDRRALQEMGNQNRIQRAVEERIKYEMMTELEKASFILGSAADSFRTLGQYNKRAFQAYKAFAIAQTIIDTISAAQKAFTSLAAIPFVGPALGAAAAAAAVVAGMARVNQIRSMQYTGYAQGGEMTVGRPAVVGENGPEIIVPKNPSVVMPNSVKEALGEGGGPVTVNFNITTLDARDFDTLLIERRSVITGIINDAMTRRGRRGVLN